MIKLRVMCGAMISNNSDFLMMKRAENRAFAPGLWGLVGGHAEPEEINDPLAACLREVFEETGITQDGFNNLKLRYIAYRRADDEIRVQYIFVGEAKFRSFIDKTEEGTLYWIAKTQLHELPMSFTLKKAIEHYILFGRETDAVYLGTATEQEGQPLMKWMTVDNWGGMSELVPVK